MNQLMLELYQQALEFAYKNISKESWNTDNFHAVVSGKFAELIVRECSGFVYNYPEKYLTRNQAREISLSMEEHFGVEE